MLDQSKSELEQTIEQLSEKYESIDDEGNFLHYTVTVAATKPGKM
jgi:hypothetical protein